MKGRTELTPKELADMKTLIRFVFIFCRENHDSKKAPFAFKGLSPDELDAHNVLLCPECTRLVKYALAMRLRCPHDPKPMCKKCPTHCYREDHREKIRRIMKFSGIYLVKRGRLDMLYHYFR